MTLSYEKNKLNILKWRANHKEQFQEIDREYKRKIYHLKKNPNEYAYYKECKKLGAIRF